MATTGEANMGGRIFRRDGVGARRRISIRASIWKIVDCARGAPGDAKGVSYEYQERRGWVVVGGSVSSSGYAEKYGGDKSRTTAVQETRTTETKDSAGRARIGASNWASKI